VTGTLASQLGLLANLTELYVGPRVGKASRIHGSLPSELFALTKLTQFFVTRCGVSGPVTGLSRLTNLESLGLSENANLNGSVNLSPLTRLENLFINDNPNLAASLADMSAMRGMTSLYVHNSSTTGSLDDITRLTQLVELGVGRSKITGSLPSALGQLSLLAYVYADRLGLTGTLPSQLFRLPLRELYLDGNALTGSVPTWISSLSTLKQLGLGRNSFVSAPNLANLSLDECYFWESCFPCASLNNANCTKECSSRDCSTTTTTTSTAAATTTTTSTTTTTAPSSSMSTLITTMLMTSTSPSTRSTSSSSSSSLTTAANDFVAPASDFDIATVAGAAGGGVVALVLIGVVLFCWCRARKSKNPEATPDVSLPSEYSRLPRMEGGSGSSDSVSVSLASAPTSAYSAWSGSSFGAPAECRRIHDAANDVIVKQQHTVQLSEPLQLNAPQKQGILVSSQSNL
jgi:hypothetical protein